MPQQCHNTVLWRVGVGAAESLSQAGICSARHRRWEVVRIYEICWRGGWQTGDILGIRNTLSPRYLSDVLCRDSIEVESYPVSLTSQSCAKKMACLVALTAPNVFSFEFASVSTCQHFPVNWDQSCFCFGISSHWRAVDANAMNQDRATAYWDFVPHPLFASGADAADHTCICLDRFEPDMINAFRRFSIFKNHSGVEGGHALGLPYAWSGTRVPLLYATLKRGWEPQGVVVERFLKLRSHLEQKRLFAIG